MYEYIKGRLASLEPTQAVIDCGGVGYLLEISLNTYEALRRAEHYRPQIAAYASALERICGKPVKESVLYFLSVGEAVEIREKSE